MLFVVIPLGETYRFQCDFAPLFPTESNSRAVCYFKLQFLALQADLFDVSNAW